MSLEVAMQWNAGFTESLPHAGRPLDVSGLYGAGRFLEALLSTMIKVHLNDQSSGKTVDPGMIAAI